MTPPVSLIARQSGKSIAQALSLEICLLNILFDHAEPMPVTDLEMALRCTRRDLWTAIRHQYALGNIKKGQPVALTSSARIAIQAGRFATMAAAA